MIYAIGRYQCIILRLWLVCGKAVEFLNNLKAERSGKRVETEVVDEDTSGMQSSVRLLCEYIRTTVLVRIYIVSLLNL